ncbi:hypothetical protein [Nitrospirillum sp. BR 11163]|nr:hypothetical protein [Nitrospirillum sp. BR 11163]MEA1675685.1 hypothetical protein [Nitrospirillum sp. BR 11163]
MSGAERPIAPDVTLQAPATIPDEDKLPPDAPLARRDGGAEDRL